MMVVWITHTVAEPNPFCFVMTNNDGVDYADSCRRPNVDRLDVAGGLTPGLSQPGNKESTGNLTV
jgi:hypothetical protein